VLADLIENPDHQVGEREAVLTLSVLVGAILMAEQSTTLTCRNRYWPTPRPR
jgi:hypothetical protein